MSLFPPLPTDDNFYLTGNNLYSGTYDSSVFNVLGLHNTTASDDTTGSEVFMFGDLQYKNSVVANDTQLNTDISSGDSQFQSTHTGSSDDTLVFHFTPDGGTPVTHSFLTEAAPQDYASDAVSFTGGNGFDAGDGDANYQAQSDASAWNTNYATWLASLPSGYTLSGSTTTIETGVNGGHPDPDATIALDITATTPGTFDNLTAVHTGDKTLLGFTVGSDHITLDGVGTGATGETTFDQFFNVTSTVHTSLNGNVVNDTTITLTDGSGHDLIGPHAWSVDLYGVDTTSLTNESDLQQFVWSQVTTNGH